MDKPQKSSQQPSASPIKAADAKLINQKATKLISQHVEKNNNKQMDDVRKNVAEKTVVKKTVAEKTVAEKTVAEKTVAEQTVLEKTVVENTVVEKTVAVEKIVDADDKVAPASPEKTEKIPIIEAEPESKDPVGTAVPRTRPPLPAPVLTGRPIVLATHLVPSLPIGLFEVLAEAIEAATGKPVVLLYESRYDRPVAKDVTDIAILPAGEEWDDGDLLPVSFVFEHRLNKDFSPAVYADVVVATDRATHVENLMDLRGHRCALPDRRRALGAATLLFNQLRTKGEGPAFFGNTLDAHSQVSALQMVAGRQVELCVLESPVIKYHRKSLPGVYSLHILSSLGPLPPYPIMINKNMPTDVVNKIKEYLLKMRDDTEWMEKFAPYGVLGFAEYSKSLYDDQDIKSVKTSAPYY